MSVVYSPAALRELDEIFDYNERVYGTGHAADYVRFIRDRIDALTTEAELGDPVEGFPDRRALTIKRRTRGHGHIAIYRVELGGTIRVLHVFHTAQDVGGRLERE